MTFFEIPETKPDKPKVTCQTCAFIYKHEYGKMKYCIQYKQRGTSYGHRKIKSRDAACPKYEKKQ